MMKKSTNLFKAHSKEVPEVLKMTGDRIRTLGPHVSG